MFRVSRVLHSGLQEFKFKGPRPSRTRHRNRVKQQKQQTQVIQTLKASQAYEVQNPESPGILTIILRKSGIASLPSQKKAMQNLGLRKLHQPIERKNNGFVRALVDRIRHKVEIALNK